MIPYQIYKLECRKVASAKLCLAHSIFYKAEINEWYAIYEMIYNKEKRYTRAYTKLYIQIPEYRKWKAQLHMWKEMEI